MSTVPPPAAGAAPPALPLDRTTVTTFRDLYNLDEMDPWSANQNYDRPLAQFNVATIGNAYNPTTLTSQVLGVGTKHTNAYLFIMPFTGEAMGRTMLLHAPTPFVPNFGGRATPYDGFTYSFSGETAAGTVLTLTFPTNAFDPSTTGAFNIPNDIAAVSDVYDQDATATNLGVIANGTSAKAIRMPFGMMVPPPFVRYLIGRRFSPRLLVCEVLPRMIPDPNNWPKYEVFINWCIASNVLVTDADTASPLYIPNGIVTPAGDVGFIVWRQGILHKLLPRLAGPSVAPTPVGAAATQVAALMGDVLNETRLARVEAAAGRIAARAPKTIGEYFGANMTNLLLFLAHEDAEDDLPAVWEELASRGTKRERETIEQAAREIAQDTGSSELAPLITPALAKKIMRGDWAGANLDDLSHGVSPFSVLVADFTSGASEQAYHDARNAALDYDEFVGSSVSPDLSDIKSLKESGAVTIPTTYAGMRAMLTGYVYLLTALFGPDGRPTIPVRDFLNVYMKRENFIMGRLQQADAIQGPARLLRYVQLNIRSYFFDVINSSNTSARARVANLDLKIAFSKLAVGDSSWLPELPSKYQLPMEPESKPDGKKKKKKGEQDEKTPGKKAQQVINNEVSTRFKEFEANITANKFNVLIQKVGTPPKVKRGGKEVDMCASYHLRGQCNTTCARAADHAPHTTEEDDKLHEWCKRAFA